MEKTLNLTLKELVFVGSILITALGNWYSQTTRLREIELRIESESKISEIVQRQQAAELLELKKIVEQRINSKK